MKIAVVSESSADEAAVKILVDAILGSKTELLALRTRPNGWPHVLNLLPNIVIALHYGTEVEGLVVVVDSDESQLHENAHELGRMENVECRLCLLRFTLRKALDNVRPLPGRTAIKTALGLAVPAIEAWYQSSLNPHITEFEWARKLMQNERLSYDKKALKQAAYGSGPVSKFEMTQLAEQSAHKLARNLEQLEERFPTGFGSLLRDLQGWLGDKADDG